MATLATLGTTSMGYNKTTESATGYKFTPGGLLGTSRAQGLTTCSTRHQKTFKIMAYEHNTESENLLSNHGQHVCFLFMISTQSFFGDLKASRSNHLQYTALKTLSNMMVYEQHT